MRHRTSQALLGTALLAAGPVFAEPLISASRNSYGLTGLIDLPTAERRADGELGATIYAIDGGLRTSFAFQITPRLQGAFRYSRTPDLVSTATGPQALYDASFDLQWQIFEAAGWRPELAVGLRDFAGTGVYSGEYLVATSELAQGLRVSGGLGWGRLGADARIASWSEALGATADRVNKTDWFQGDAKPFLGASYAYGDHLTLKAEYSGDDYAAETQGGYEHSSPFSFGADYRLNGNASLGAYVQNGQQVGLQFTLNIDPRQPPFPSGIETAPLPVRPRPSLGADHLGWSGAWAKTPDAAAEIQRVLAQSLAQDGQILESMALTRERVEVRVRNETYGAQPQALGHVARLLTRAMPASVETFVITSVEHGLPLSSVTMKRSDLERLENGNSIEMLNKVVIASTPLTPETPLTPTEGAFPRLKWALTPFVDASLFDDDDPFLVDLGLALHGSYEFAPGLSLSGTLQQRVAGNLADSTRVSDSPVQHVRSDLGAYQKHGDMTIQRLTGDWYARPTEAVYTHVQGGLLERMYGGIAAEALWKPVDQRLALGVELASVRQRDYNQQLDFIDYKTITGHASAYYDIGNGFTGQLDFGRYLAQDWGGTLAVDREFQNGWKVGAFATVTDMSAEDFGEGSFDKGIRVTIPVAWTTGKPSVNTVKTVVRPASRDGGARLDLEGRLYDSVRGAHTGDLYDRWGRFWR